MKKRWLGKKEFDQIIKLLGLKVPQKTVASIIGRSTGLVHKVGRVKTWEAYVEEKRKYAIRIREGETKPRTGRVADMNQQFVVIREALANIEREFARRG